jgi:hypothetical protein
MPDDKSARAVRKPYVAPKVFTPAIDLPGGKTIDAEFEISDFGPRLGPS